MDTISRQAAIEYFVSLWDCMGEIADKDEWRDVCETTANEIPSAQPDVPDTNVGDINKFIDGLVEIFADIRERHVDDSVCGLCEYDGAYIVESGDWCNECPGFNRDDCFKLRDGIRKKWISEITACMMPSAQPEIIHCNSCKYWTQSTGKMKGYGLGRCDFHDADLATCNGFCYWAERRNDG